MCFIHTDALPLHPAAPSRLKPSGQVQTSPVFSICDGQPQSELPSGITWLPGHWGGGGGPGNWRAAEDVLDTRPRAKEDVWLRTVVLMEEADGGRKKKCVRRHIMNTNEKSVEFQITRGCCVTRRGFAEISDEILNL